MLDIKTKLWVFVVVTALHVVACIMILRIPGTPLPVDDAPASMLFFIPAKRMERKEPKTSKPAISDQVESEAILLGAEAISATAETPPKVDWDELRSLVAEDHVRRRSEALEKEEAMTGKQSNGINEPKVPSLFGPPHHRHGDSESRNGNALITWINNRCFVTNQLYPSMPMDHTGPKIVCKDRHKADTDLFNHLKPSYLKSLPQPPEPSR